MIDLTGIMSVPFLKKRPFTGSDQGMRYLLRKAERVVEEAAGETPAVTRTVLEAVVWPEPFGFEATADEKKVTKEFSFDQEGIRQAAAWMNEQHEAGNYGTIRRKS